MSKEKKTYTSLAEQELDKAQEQFQAFDDNIKAMTVDRMNEAPKQELEPLAKLSQIDISKSKDIYLKPKRTIGSREKFNEKYRDQYNFAKEYVCFVAENREIIGDTIDLWTKPFAGMPAEEWSVPPGKPVWGPRYLAERIKSCSYHRLRSEENTITSQDGTGAWKGQIVVDHVVQRLDALPVSTKKSVFMGAGGF
jgi:hypothetical protein